MSNPETTSGQRAAETIVADRYRAAGYEVAVQPGKESLPPGLREFQPDLLAVRGDEKVIVEVKLVATAQSMAGRLQAIRAAICKEPGWRFDVVMADEDRGAEPSLPAPAWSDAQIKKALADVRKLKEIGLIDAAIPILFAAAEAKLIRLARAEHIVLGRYSLGSLLTRLASEGLLESKEFNLLTEGRRVRDALVHGRQAAELDASTVQAILDAVERIADPAAVESALT